MERMNRLMEGDRWVLLLRGIVALLLGLIAFLNLKATALVLYIWLGTYAILDGLLQIYAAIFKRRPGEAFLPGMLSGLGSLLIGIILFALPNLSLTILLALIAARAILQGIKELTMAFRSREQFDGKTFWFLLLVSAADMIFGIWMIFQPAVAGLTVVAVIGIYALVAGTLLILRALSGGIGGTPATA